MMEDDIMEKANNMWLLFAILSAVFAAATAILAKIGIEGVDSNLARPSEQLWCCC